MTDQLPQTAGEILANELPAVLSRERPGLYTPQLLAVICDRLSSGEPLAAICRDPGMPHDNTVRNWMAASEAVAVAIAHAREAGEDWLGAECLQIADDSENDYGRRKDADGNEVFAFNSEHVQRSKLRIETRLKLLAKWNPKKWGDRMNVDHGVQESLAETLRAARERAASRDE